MTASKPVSLSRYLVDSGTNEDLAEVIMGLSSACWLTSIALKSIALDGKLGAAETTNVQGEVQKPLDLLANDYFTRALGQSDRVTAILSEEVEEVTWF